MKKCLITLLIVVALLSTAAMANTTVTSPVSIVVNPGALSLTPIQDTPAFQNVSIPGIMNSLPYTATITPGTEPSFKLQDATGSGLGWHVNFNISPLAGPNNHKLDVNFQQTAAQLSVDAGFTSSQAVDATHGPNALALSAATVETDTEVVKTDTGYGNGTYDYATSTGCMTIPISSSQLFAGTYSGNFTATILQGPGGTGSWTGTIQ